MRDLLKELESIVAPIVGKEGLMLIDMVLRGQRHNRVLEIFIDSENGVTAETCAAMSRELSTELDGANLMEGRYTLIVSSPGIDRPLKLPMQYRKNTGRRLEVVFRDGTVTKRIHGTLASCSETDIHLRTENNLSYTVPYDTIERAQVVLRR